MKADIVILTPISPEYEAALLHLHQVKAVKEFAYLCQIGKFKGKTTSYQVAICETSSGNLPVALAAKACIQFFQPSYMFLIGTAGGVKQFNIGDIIIGTIGYDYEGGKEYDDGFKARPKVAHSDKKLVALAQKVGQQDNWKSRIKYSIPTNEIKIKAGAIASGSKVLATLNSNALDIIKTHYNDTVALEMEAYGFLSTLSDYPDIPAINIRSISDLLSDKETANLNDSKEIASSNAAAFTFEVIYNLERRKTNNSLLWSFAFVSFMLLSFFFFKKWESLQKPLPQKVIVEAPKINNNNKEEEEPSKSTEKPKLKEKKIIIPPPLEPKKDSTQNNTAPPIIEDNPIKKLFRVDIFVDIEATQYLIKNSAGEIVEQSQGHKIFNLPQGRYNISFYNKKDTGQYFMNIPNEKTVILNF